MTVTFEIWQCKIDDAEFEEAIEENGIVKGETIHRSLCFLPLRYWEKANLTPNRAFYNKVYERTDEIDQNLPIKRYLEQLFEEFNRNHPEDYKGRSMSTSDVVIVNDIPYFCDSIGFEQLEKF